MIKRLLAAKPTAVGILPAFQARVWRPALGESAGS
jgi:hypothetical protein